MESLKRKVLKCLQSLDVYEVAIAINADSFLELCDVINELLNSTDTEIVSSACLLIRDLVLYSNQYLKGEILSQKYEESSILKTLEQLLFSQNCWIRKAAVYTLGKTCSYNSIPALNEAFITFRDSDPLLLPRLMGEMGWLRAENFWELLDSMMESQVFVTRWAVVELLPEFLEDAQSENELSLGKLRCLEKLRQDSDILVQAEAEHQYQLLKFRNEMHHFSKSDHKKMQKELDRKYMPVLSFSYVSNRFEYYLNKKGLTQYSLDELENFIEITSIIITH
jgi:HEAT repeat protein